MKLWTRFPLSAIALVLSHALHAEEPHYFTRIATLPVCQQLEANCNTDETISAEIIAASQDGQQLIYTSSPTKAVGFIDIRDPSQPKPAGLLPLAGKPTSVAAHDHYALVAVNTSKSYAEPAGQLAIIDLKTQQQIHSIDLGGQPDSIAISPDHTYAAIAIENERDEALNEGKLPQSPAGYLMIVDLKGDVKEWQTRKVDLTGLAKLYAEDPEPEYVAINTDNIAALTLQENNHIVLVKLADGTIVNHFSAGTVNLTDIDTKKDKPALIDPKESQANRLREPDGITWINNDLLATANEGDLDGGSRDFTIFNTQGEVVYSAGNQLDQVAIRVGHYPDHRSASKGNEPENVTTGRFQNQPYLFVNSERSSLVYVYDISQPAQPKLHQVLPAAVAPEGVISLPERDLVVVASEVDSRDDQLRGAVNIYQYGASQPNYPTLSSAPDSSISWGALSGLAADPNTDATLYAVNDSFYQQNRIFKIDLTSQPAQIVDALRILDSNDVLAKLKVAPVAADTKADSDERKAVFDSADLAALINADKSVNLDPEGIAVASDGGFWIVSEGAGTLAEADKQPINSLNMLLKTNAQGVIEQVILLPEAWNQQQVRFGFEGVTEANGLVVTALQRAWGTDKYPRIAIYNPQTQQWMSVFYPLDKAESPHKGWVGLSDITAIGDHEFMVVERDNKAGPDAAIKRLYTFKLDPSQASDTVVEKTLVRDLIPDLKKANGLIPEKIEGLAILKNGDVIIVNDNDGIKDNSGETLLLNLGKF